MQQTSNVEYLFENFSIVEILDIQHKLRNDIDKRKEDVKELVNERYRDLIEAADTIQHMKDKCQEATESVGRLQSLNESFSFIKPKSKTSNNQKITIARKAKLIRNAQIYVWKALDEARFLDAAVMRFGCLQLCRELNRTTKDSDIVPDLTPLIAKLEPSIKELDTIIEKACYRHIVDNADDPLQLVDAFICIALNNDYESQALLGQYYNKMAQAITAQIEKCNDLDSAILAFYSFLLNTLKVSQNLMLQSGLTNPAYLTALRKLSKLKEFPFKGSEKIGFDKAPFKPNISERLMQDISKETFAQLTLQFIKDVQANVERALKPKLDQERSIKLLMDSLAKLYEANRIQKYPTWDGLCDLIMGKQFPHWDTFLRQPYKDRIMQLSTEMIAEAFQSIDQQKCIQCPFESFDELLWDSGSNQNYPIELQKFALSPAIATQLEVFKSKLASLLNDAASLKLLNSFAADDEQDLLQTVSQLITKNISALLVDLKAKLAEEAIKSEEQLAIAKLCRFLVYSVTDLKKFLLSTGDDPLQALLLCSQESLNNYFSNFIAEEYGLFQESMTSDDHFKKTLTNVATPSAWDTVVLNEDTEDGKKIASSIKIPAQLSFVLYKLLCNVSKQANRVSGHTLAKSVITNIWLQLFEKVLNCYQDQKAKLEETSLSSAEKQTVALQYNFDLLCLKQLLITTREEQLRVRYLASISEAAKSYETLIDPFDLHVLSPYVQTNLIKSGRGLTLLLGTLMPEALMTQEPLKSKTTALDLMSKSSYT